MATFALIDLQEAASVGLNGEGGDSAVADFSQLLWLSVTAALADSSSSSSLTVLLRLPPAVFSVSRLESWKYIHAILAAIYVTATAYIMRALDTTSSSVAHLRLPLDVVILDWCSYDPTSLSSGLQNHFSMDALGNIIHRSRDGDDEMKANTGDLTLLPHQRLVLSPYFSQTSIVASSAASPAVGGAYSDVALGGTFDHLHIGHKILLTAALWITQYRLVCGVSNMESLKRKTAATFMESIDTRIAVVKSFLEKMRRPSSSSTKTPGIYYQVVPIYDPYGPTRDDTKLTAIFGSKETEKGCESVNTLRMENGLNPLDILLIDVVSDSNVSESDMALKISSSSIRRYLEQQSQGGTQCSPSTKTMT